MRTLTAALALLVASACKGPPARLFAGESDTVIVNNLRPVQLPMRVLDARGHELPDTGVRYEWMSGVPVPTSVTGVVTCMQPGNATVRAALGNVATIVRVLCRPVYELRTVSTLHLVVGDSAQDLPIAALGADGRPVALLAGSARIRDSAIATLYGLRVRPRSPGHTWVGVRVGDRGTSIRCARVRARTHAGRAARRAANGRRAGARGKRRDAALAPRGGDVLAGDPA